MKKLGSLLLTLLLISTLVYADVPNIAGEEAKAVFAEYGYTLGAFSEALPDAPSADETEFQQSASLQNEKVEGLDAELTIAYDAAEDTWEPRGAGLSYLYAAGSTREERVEALRALINNGFENTESLPFYQAALAFLRAAHPALDEEGAKTVLNQIIIQGEINGFNALSPMTSYAADAADAETYDSTADSKNLVYEGNKYLLIVKDEGYILSLRPTEEPNTISLRAAAPSPAANAPTADPAADTEGEPAAGDDTETEAAADTASDTEGEAAADAANDTEGEAAAEGDTEATATAAPEAGEKAADGKAAPAGDIVVHKQYGWDGMNSTLTKALGSDFLPNQAAGFLAIPAEEASKDAAQIFVTGNGVMLSYGNVNSAFRLNVSTGNAMLNALAAIVRNYPTLNSYALIAGSDPLSLHVYFENSVQTYDAESISNLADILSGALSTPVLLGEDESKPAEKENLDAIVEKAVEVPGASGSDAIIAGETEAILGEEPSATPDSKLPSEGQVEVNRKSVNIRDAAGGKIIFKVKRGDILTIVGAGVKSKGWTWYQVEFNGEVGYVRADTVKLLDYKVEITPTPSPKPNTTPAPTTGAANDGTDEEDAEDDTTKAGTAPASTTAANNTADTAEYTTLRRGNKGDAVNDLQERLIELGYLKGTADGKFGGKTETAVKAAQKAFSQQQSGVADAALQTALFAENAMTAEAAEVMTSDPNNMKIDVSILSTAESYMKNRYAKTVSGYTTGINRTEVDSRVTLTANSVHTNSTSFEVSISATNATGAQNINPRFEIRIMNLNVQDVTRIDLVRGKKTTPLDRQYWTVENGMVLIDLSTDLSAVTDMLNTTLTKEIHVYGVSNSYTIDFTAALGPHSITKHMNEVWKNLGAAKIAKAAAYLKGQTED